MDTTCPQCGGALDEAARCKTCDGSASASFPSEDRSMVLRGVLFGVGAFILLASLGGLVFYWIHSTQEARQKRALADMEADDARRARDKDMGRKDFFNVDKEKDKGPAIGQPRTTERRIALANGSYSTNSNVGFQETIAYIVRLETDHRYKIEMRSQQLDSYLEVADRFGQVLARDDDGAGFLNARIIFNCKQTDEYHVRARDLGNRAGPFEFEIRDETIPETAVHLTLTKGQVNVSNKLVVGDRPDPKRNVPRKLYTLDVERGHRYAVDLESKDFDAFLRVENAVNVEIASNDDGGDGRNSRLQFTPFQTARYRIVATSCAGGVGDFQLKIRDLDAAPLIPPMPPEVKPIDVKPAEPKVSDINKSVISKALVRHGEITVTEILGNEAIRGAVWSKSGDLLFVLKADGTLSRIRVTDLFEEKRVELGKPGIAIASSAQGLLVSFIQQERQCLVDTASFAVKKRFTVKNGSFTAPALAAEPLDVFLVTTVGKDVLAGQGTIELFDLNTGSEVSRIDGPIRNARLAPDGRTYFAVEGMKLRSFKIESNKLVEGPSMTVGSNSKISISPDSKYVCASASGNNAAVYEVADLPRVAFRLNTNNGSTLRAVAFDSALKLAFTLDGQGKLGVYTFDGTKRKEIPLQVSTISASLQMSCPPQGGKLLIQQSSRLLYLDTEGLRSVATK